MVHLLANKAERPYIWKVHRKTGETSVDSHAYLISEDGEFVKVVGDQYEYTGMYFVQ